MCVPHHTALKNQNSWGWIIGYLGTNARHSDHPQMKVHYCLK